MNYLEQIKLAPSILAADVAHLADQVAQVVAAGADRIHVDVMDGHFVPNITFGPVVVRWLRPVTPVGLEVHLMIAEPERYLDAFAEAGADTLIVHLEGSIHLNRTVQAIHGLGKKAGVALNPATPASLLEEILPDVELVLAMTVNPGFGGQEFLTGTLPKIRRIRSMIDQVRPDCELEVDGGIEPHTAPLVVEAGARVLVAGSAVFKAPGGAAAGMSRLKDALATRRVFWRKALMNWHYPIQDYGPLMKGMVIGGLGILHVFLAQLAIGGGMLLCYFEWLRRTGRSKNAGRFVSGYFQALVLVSFVLGALTGVAMWFTTIQVSPRTIGVLVDEFHWIWATEWTFFCVEVVAGYTFLRYKDWLSGRDRMTLLVCYAVAGWFSLFWINGILSFQLTPGRWLESHDVFAGLFNPSFWPSLLYRTVAAMAIAALAACVVINLTGPSDRDERRELIGRASVFLAPMVLMPLLGIWFLAAMPAASRFWVLGGSVTMTMFMGIGISASLLIGVYALGAFWFRKLYINGFTAALLCATGAGGDRRGRVRPRRGPEALFDSPGFVLQFTAPG